MVIPFAAGGPTDVLGRVVAAKMGEIARPAGGGRERHRRRRPDRLQTRRRQPRRTATTSSIGTVGTHAQVADALQKAALQFADRFHPGRPDRPGADRADRAQGSAGEEPQGVRRLRQGQPGQDAVRLGRRRLRHPSRLRAAELHDRRQHHPRAVSRHRARDAGPDRRPHRLHLRGRHHDQVAARRRHHQGHRAARPQAFQGVAGPADRRRAGHQGPDRLHLERDLPAEGRARRRS